MAPEMGLDEGAARILRQNLPDECLDGGAPLTSALVSRPESTARAMDLMEMKIEALQQELVRLVQGSGAGPAASGGRALVAQAAQLRGSAVLRHQGPPVAALAPSPLPGGGGIALS